MKWYSPFNPLAYWRKGKEIFFRMRGDALQRLDAHLRKLQKLHDRIIAVAPSQRGLLGEKLQSLQWGQVGDVRSPAGDTLLFYCTNWVTSWRVDTFFEKEPETIAWLDSIPEGSCVWDIGANVGLYSIYAAKVRKCRVYAFEPSVFNLEILARNVALNDLSHAVTIVPVALSDSPKEGAFALGTIVQGGACSTFAEGYDHHGNPLKKTFEYKTLSLSGDALLALYALPGPDYIKLDVDGIEHLILSGMTGILLHENLCGILVETNFDFKEQAGKIELLLSSSGFVLKEKSHAEMFNDTEFKNIYNCIWERK